MVLLIFLKANAALHVGNCVLMQGNHETGYDKVVFLKER